MTAHPSPQPPAPWGCPTCKDTREVWVVWSDDRKLLNEGRIEGPAYPGEVKGVGDFVRRQPCPTCLSVAELVRAGKEEAWDEGWEARKDFDADFGTVYGYGNNYSNPHRLPLPSDGTKGEKETT